MGSSLVIGGKQIRPEELQEKYALGELDALPKSSAPPTDAAFATASSTPGFTPIGIGKPLSVEILTVYTGNAPTKKLFGKKSDLLVVSGVKGVETFGAQPKAINQLVPKVGDQEYLQPSAFDQGSPIVYYTPSMVNDTTLCSFQMSTDRFDQEIFDQIANLFSKAGGLPIFVPQSTYLLAGSFLLKTVAKLANALIDKGPFFNADLILRFDTPGIPISEARNAVIYDDRDENEMLPHEVRYVGNSLKLVNPQTNKVYEGDAPYLIVGLDGRERKNLSAFTPTAAQAALLEKFYGSGDPGGAVIQALSSALELYNDSESRQKAVSYQTKLEQLTQQIQGLDPNAADYETKKADLLKSFQQNDEQYDAWRKRIQNEIFQLPEISAPT